MSKNHCVEPYFLGPKSENEYWVRKEIQNILDHWFQWRKSLFTDDPAAISTKLIEDPKYLEKQQQISTGLEELSTLLKSETPKYTPRYIGHMISEVSLPAFLGHISVLLHNPNNTSYDSSKAGLLIENQAIGFLTDLVGYDKNEVQGHFTSGGTVANFEAIWRARFRLDHFLSLALYLHSKGHKELDVFSDCTMGWDQFDHYIKTYSIVPDEIKNYSFAANNPYKMAELYYKQTGTSYKGPVMLVPGNKHFSWIKGCNIFGFGESSLWGVPLDVNGRMDVQALEDLINKAQMENRPILMVVSVTGTTETGEIDPVHEVQDLLDKLKSDRGLHIWHHIDAAYGGFMCSLIRQPEIGDQVLTELQKKSFAAINRAHSITLDPHKLGYIPYSCGAFLSKDKMSYSVPDFLAPYLDRPNIKSPWSSTIEGSRSASGAAATWLTAKTFGFTSESFAKLLSDTFKTCRDFKILIDEQLPELVYLEPGSTNILCFNAKGESLKLSQSNELTEALFNQLVSSTQFSVSKTVLHTSNYSLSIQRHLDKYEGIKDDEQMTLIRCVFMNPFWQNSKLGSHLKSDFVRVIKDILNESA